MKWTVSILGAFAIAGLAIFGFWARESCVKFLDLREAKSRLIDVGLYCTPDRADGNLATGFLLSHERLSWNDAGSLCKVGRMAPAWQGKVWVTFNSPLFQLQTLPENAGLRVWGNVFAFGDETLLREIDGLMP